MAVAAGWVGAASPAAAQQVVGEVSVQRFDPAPGPNNFVTTRSARTEGEMRWTAAAMVNYAYAPLVVNIDPAGPAPAESIPVVENLVTGDLYGSLTIIPQLQVSLRVPVTWSDGRGIRENAEIPLAGDEISAVGMGDVYLEAKGRIYGEADSPIAVGAYLFGTFPGGNLTQPGTYIGNASGSVGGAAVVDGSHGIFSWGVNLGGLWREEAVIGATTLGSEMRWSTAVGVQVGPLLRLVLEEYGATNFEGDGGSSIETIGAAQITPLGKQFTMTAGGGAGVLRGIGGPTARGFLGVMYDFTTLDADGDGISDDKDACPTDAEDRDGFEDGDGCPEIDNDQDGIPDSEDECPNEPEDLDGFEDKDGCPDLDNDQDGIPDVADQCPDEPETKNGFEDEDGCPDVKDTDGDGVPDHEDQCPEEPEDTDGFEDTDGCPDPDNDQDGIPDNMDECIDTPEDGKGEGREVDDGCPLEEPTEE